MKFAIRDDDLNYFYTPKFMEDNIGDIWDICPISMSAVPFVKGNWIENTKILETLGSNNVSKEVLNQIQNDNQIYDIANNQELVGYIINKLNEKKIYLTIHAVHHRNEDSILPVVGNNFSIGAEFYTDRDLKNDLKNAVEHLEKTFKQEIIIFTPPQNLYSKKGFEAIASNNLNICAYPIQLKKDIGDYCALYGYLNCIKLVFHKKINKSKPYPYLIKVNSVSIIDHRSLQPATDVRKLYEDFEYVYSKGGDFVLSTHSYAFNYKMQGSDKTMGEILREFLLYVNKRKNVKFVSINKIFGK